MPKRARYDGPQDPYLRLRHQETPLPADIKPVPGYEELPVRRALRNKRTWDVRRLGFQLASQL
jgi:hypothetical protein